MYVGIFVHKRHVYGLKYGYASGYGFEYECGTFIRVCLWVMLACGHECRFLCGHVCVYVYGEICLWAFTTVYLWIYL